MKSYLITYDLNKEGSAYDSAREKILKAIKSLGESLQIATTTWLVKTSLSNAEQVSDHVRKSMDGNDYIFVTQLCSDRQGWLPKQKWEWINSAPSCCRGW